MSEQSSEAFLEACGLAGPLELLVRHPRETGGGRRCLFEQPFVLVGRDPRADLFLDAAEVGRRHAYLQVVAGHLFCVDLESRTGTHWQGGRRPSGWLAPGQAVRVGPFEVRLVRAGGRGVGPTPEWSPTETRLQGPPAGRGAVVEFWRGDRLEARCRLTRTLALVGRSAVCRLRLTSPGVSKCHGALLRTPAGIWAIDLHGRGGIRVRGASVAWAPLADGDRLEVGPFAMRLRGVSAARPAPAATLPAPAPPRLTPDADLLGPVMQQMTAMQQQMFDQFQQALVTVVQTFGALHRDQTGLVREELDRLRDVTQELHALQAELAAPPAATAGNAAPAAGVTGRGAQAPDDAGARRPESRGSTGAAPAPEAAPAPGRPQAGNIHVWLSQRIAALEQERQSRWQKVMAVMLGK